MALLSETNPPSAKCLDCHKPADPGKDRCSFHRYSHVRFKQAMEAARPTCPQCDAKHDGYYGRKFCTQKCADAHRIEDAMAFVEAARKQLNLNSATGVLHKLFRYLADRDGAECYLCGNDVNLELKRETMRGPSVDHVLARSKGGTHDLDNLALTHLICNIRKGNRDAEVETERIRNAEAS